MPLLFRLAIHDSLVEARQEMCKAHLFAYLDDVCAVCALDQDRSMCNILANKVETGAGISHTGKTRVKNRASGVPTRHPGPLGRSLDPRRDRNSGDASGVSRVPNVWRENADLGTQSRGYQICSVRGRFCCSAVGHGVTTCCAHCHPASRGSPLKDMALAWNMQ